MILRQSEQGNQQRESAVYMAINEHFELLFNAVMTT